jgi:tetratricopeptide (TPR) repeat protein
MVAVDCLSKIIAMLVFDEHGDIRFVPIDENGTSSNGSSELKTPVSPFSQHHQMRESEVDSASDAAFADRITPSKIFELRGMLLMEINSHLLAIDDFSKTILIDPHKPAAYAHRGACYKSTGNYERAIEDLARAQDLGYFDMTYVYLHRGLVERLMRKPEQARISFQSALEELLSPQSKCAGDVVTEAFVRLYLMDCWADQGQFDVSLSTGEAALRRLHSDSAKVDAVRKLRVRSARRVVYDIIHTVKMSPEELTSLRVEWCLRYYVALALFELHRFEKYIEAAKYCTETLSPFAFDGIYIGALEFFLGQSYCRLGRHSEAAEAFKRSAQSPWASMSDANYTNIYFALGKANQILGRDDDSLCNFDLVITRDSEHVWAIFRRGWLHRAFGRMAQAAADFETCRRLRPDDANFCINYRATSRVEYMELRSDTDLVAPFPRLLDTMEACVSGLG